jgi:glycosyltransferase involved in cell wall biosynthesis
MNNCLVSVCLITFNHEKYIKQAIESVLMQKVDFQFELVIADDFSTDETREILLEYKSKFPNLIKLILQDKNVGAANNFCDLISYPKSKYIAYLEGDDFWTNPYKLQRQISILENSKDIVFCFHNAQYLNENTRQFLDNYSNILFDREISLEEFLFKNYVPTASLVFEKKYFFPIPEWYKNIKYGDYALYLLILFRSNKKAYYLSDVMSVYRIHDNGSFSKLGDVDKALNYINLFTTFKKKVFKNKFNSYLNKIISFNYAQLILLLFKQKAYFNSTYYFLLLFIKNPLYIYQKVLKIKKELIRHQ